MTINQDQPADRRPSKLSAALQNYPGYKRYQEIMDRDIPVVILRRMG